MIAFGRWAHMATAALFAAGVVLQAFLAGVGLTQLGGSGDFSTHIAVGYSLMALLALAVLVFAIVGRVPRRQVAWSIGLIVLYVVQTSLPFARDSSPVIAALHPANAMVLLLVAVGIAWRAGAIAREPRPD
jgi:hypothetical protein